jgi:hypothetical protein
MGDEMTLELYNIKTRELESVEAWPTVTPYFMVTKPMASSDPDTDTSKYFSVTHVRSTALALGPFTDKRVAELCAAVLGYLPVPWDDFTMAVSEQFSRPDPEQAKRFAAAWSAIPQEIKEWRRIMHLSCPWPEEDDDDDQIM